jgi:hypothetical protein
MRPFVILMIAALIAGAASVTGAVRTDAMPQDEGRAGPDSTESRSPDDSAARPAPPLPTWLSTIQLFGTLETEAHWGRHGLDPAGSGRAESDLYLRLFELAVSSNLSYWAQALAVVNTEYVDDQDDPGTGNITLDEGHIDLGQDGVPWTLVAGYRTQPFGVFESHLVTDPITQDAYETQETGATVGWTGVPGGAIELTMYQGAAQLEELQGSQLLDGAKVGWQPRTSSQLDSWIATASAGAQDGDVTVYGAWLSEPGRDRRNHVLGLGLHAAMPGRESLVLDGEWMRALSRETYPAAARAHEEGALSVSLTYSFVFRDRQTLGGGNFKNRREHLRTHPVEISARYERFNDDGLTADLGAWTLRDRWSAGGRYTFLESASTSVYSLLELQYRTYRRPDGLEGFHGDNTRIYAKLGMSF